MNILISGVWSTNKGDRAIATFLVEKLHQNSKVEKIYISTNDTKTLKLYMPNYVEVIDFGYTTRTKFERIYYKLIAFPILREALLSNKKRKLRFLCTKRYSEVLNDVNYVILTGGHHITTMREKDSIHPLTYDLGLINLSGLKYCLWSQTIGPLKFHNMKNRKYLLKLIGDAEQVFIRDENSIEALNKQSHNLSNVVRSYDSVFGLKDVFSSDLDTLNCLNTVGVSIFYSNYKSKKEIDEYISKMTEICNYILTKKFRIKFFPMETNEREIEIISYIANNLDSEFVSLEDTNVKTLEHLKKVNSCTMFVGHKTHSVIMSLTLGVPLIGLCYHMKTYDFMKTFDMEEYAILDDDYSFKDFKNKFNALSENQIIIREQLKQSAKKISKKVNSDFERLISNE